MFQQAKDSLLTKLQVLAIRNQSDMHRHEGITLFAIGDQRQELRGLSLSHRLPDEQPL